MAAASDPSGTVTVVKGVAEALAGKGISLTSEAVSTNVHRCGNECSWRAKEEEWVLSEDRFWPFSLLTARIVLIIAFEYNGCDVNRARFRLSPKSFNKWFNDSAKYAVVATGGASRIPGEAGCKDCCKTSVCVEFDVHLTVSWDWVRTAGDSWKVRMCGDGSIDITK